MNRFGFLLVGEVWAGSFVDLVLPQLSDVALLYAVDSYVLGDGVTGGAVADWHWTDREADFSTLFDVAGLVGKAHTGVFAHHLLVFFVTAGIEVRDDISVQDFLVVAFLVVVQVLATLLALLNLVALDEVTDIASDAVFWHKEVGGFVVIVLTAKTANSVAEFTVKDGQFDAGSIVDDVESTTYFYFNFSVADGIDLDESVLNIGRFFVVYFNFFSVDVDFSSWVRAGEVRLALGGWLQGDVNQLHFSFWNGNGDLDILLYLVVFVVADKNVVFVDLLFQLLFNRLMLLLSLLVVTAGLLWNILEHDGPAVSKSSDWVSSVIEGRGGSLVNNTDWSESRNS